MNTRFAIVAAIAVISTCVAIAEGILLLQRPAESQLEVAVPPSQPHSTPGGRQVAVQPPLVPDLPVARDPDQAVPQAEIAASPPDAALPPEAVAEASPPQEPAQPELTPEQKAAEERAKAKARMTELMAAQMEQGLKMLLDRLQLDEAQKALAADTIDRLRQQMLQMAMGPMEMGEQATDHMNELRRNAVLAGNSEEQIAALLKPEQDKMMVQIRDHVINGLTEFQSTLEEIRPILNPAQAASLDQINKELQMQRETTKRMMDAARDKPAPPAP